MLGNLCSFPSSAMNFSCALEPASGAKSLKCSCPNWTMTSGGLRSTWNVPSNREALVARKRKLMEPRKPLKKPTLWSYLLVTKVRCGAVHKQTNKL